MNYRPPPDSDTLAALVAAIRANLDDELARLVTADWFEENGDPDRAEYIRLTARDQATLLWPTGSEAAVMFVDPGEESTEGWTVYQGEVGAVSERWRSGARN